MLLIAPVLRHRPAPGLAPGPAPESDQFACQEFVELVTDYLDGVLAPELEAKLQTHLTDCDGCTEYLHQIGMTIDALEEAGRRLAPGPTVAARDLDPPDR
jgi:anti-sigma factor RsiW